MGGGTGTGGWDYPARAVKRKRKLEEALDDDPDFRGVALVETERQHPNSLVSLFGLRTSIDLIVKYKNIREFCRNVESKYVSIYPDEITMKFAQGWLGPHNNLIKTILIRTGNHSEKLGYRRPGREPERDADRSSFRWKPGEADEYR